MMNQYKDTTQQPNTLETQKKQHIARFINALLDCLLIAGAMLFLLLVMNNTLIYTIYTFNFDY